MSACVTVPNLSRSAGANDRGQKPTVGRKGEMLIREPLINRDIPQPFAGQALKDVDALDIEIGNGDPLTVCAEGEAAAIQVEIDRNLGRWLCPF